MDFGLSEEQELLQETVRRFVAEACPATRLRELFEGEESIDPALWRGLGELGVLGLAVPEDFGGAGLEVLDLALVAEVLGGGALPGPFFGHALATLAIVWGGSTDQRERWLPKLATGDAIASLAVGEGAAGWDPSEWIVGVEGGLASGAKDFVLAGDRADLLVVGTAGGGLGLIEAGDAGVDASPIDGLDRTRRVARIALSNARCDMLTDGAATAHRVRDADLVLLAADAFGAAWQLLHMTIEYAGTREQFGTPLAQFQAVKHQIANAATALEPARGLFWYAAHAIDHLPERAAHAAAVAKAHVTDRALEVAKECVELHGGVGYTWESDVQIWFKRVLFDRALFGAPDAHRLRSADLAGW